MRSFANTPEITEVPTGTGIDFTFTYSSCVETKCERKEKETLVLTD